MRQITLRAMGCEVLAALDGDGPPVEAALTAVPGWFAAWEQSLSRFRADSELMALNGRAGAGWTVVSSTLWEVIRAAIGAAEQSGGLVTPTVLDALERTGYSRDFAVLDGVAPEQPHPSAGGKTSDWRGIEIDASWQAVALPRGVRIDLGGIAKGWAADSAARRLKATGPALVDAGGDIAVSGPRADGGPWAIAVADPINQNETIELLLIHAGGVATSGRDYRRWRQGGHERHHIIDPRTGMPAATDLLSVTVIAASATEAEQAAKTALILGSDKGLSWLAARPHLAGLLVTEAGTALRTASLDAYCWRPAYSEAQRD